MKKIMVALILFINALLFVSCAPVDTPSDIDGSSSTDTKNEPITEPQGFYFHYYRSDKDYKNWNMWIWETGKDGKNYNFQDVDDYGSYMKFEWSAWTTNVKDNGINFIVKEAKPWSDNPAKDVDADRSVSFSNMTLADDGYYHVYLKSGDPTVYGVIQEVGDEITRFDYSVDYSTKTVRLKLETNSDMESFTVKSNGTTILSNSKLDESKVITNTNQKFEYNFDKELPELSSNIYVSVKFKESGKIKTKIVDFSPLYYTQLFSDKYTYDGTLGAIYTEQSTTFKVWSPISSKISLRIYENGTPSVYGGNDIYDEYEMTSSDKGVWSAVVPGNLNGKYYTYVVTNNKYKNMEVVDPYAKSTGINGLRGMILDFTTTNPEGWDNVQSLNINPQSLTVYETHVADLTSSTTWGGTKENAKKFKGFYEEGTTYTENGVTVKTGFDHIKELGVNAVQLVPVFDQANDEREGKTTFNWGYNPLNYNTIEGCYSSDPYDGAVRVKEFKELVQAYNQAGIGIIMDVVYNHVNSLEKSNFDVLMPNYYFRYVNGSASNGSGCGNETASELSMFRKFMIDSTEFLATEYKLSGFRFDLMGLHDTTTMAELSKNLHEKVSESFVVYGEPWTGGNSPLSANLSAKQSNLSSFVGYGCFNDKMRDALIKGGMSGPTEKGWVNTSKTLKTDVNNIIYGLRGNQLGSYNFDPLKSINYVTCHDNYTLYDRMKAAGITDEEDIKNMCVLANSFVFTSQGVAFMLAGEEFLRTKGGNHNSYNSSYEVNELNYALKVKNIDVFENYKKLIALKQNSNLFARNAEQASQIEFKTNTDGSLIYFDLIDEVNNVSYRIAYSNGSQAQKNVDFTGYTLYLDTLNKENLDLNGVVNLLPYQVIIATKELQ